MQQETIAKGQMHKHLESEKAIDMEESNKFERKF